VGQQVRFRMPSSLDEAVQVAVTVSNAERTKPADKRKVFSARRDASSQDTMRETVDLRERKVPQKAMDAPGRWRVVGGTAQPTTGRGTLPIEGHKKGNSLDAIIVTK
jgi:hypothetical protein